MKTTTRTKSHDYYAARVMAIGMGVGLAAMVALFVAGLVKDSAGMAVMAASCAALLAGVWSSTTVAARKRANTRAQPVPGGHSAAEGSHIG